MYALPRCFTVLLLASALSACGSLVVSGQTHGGRPGGAVSADVQRDAAITAAINRLFVRDEQISAFDVRIDTHDGVVGLTGHVRDERAKQRAIELARSADGVRRVESRLLVAPQ
jgi:osmotically-inducible protein OsmY